MKLQSVLLERAQPARLMHKSKMARSTRRRKEEETVVVSSHYPVLTWSIAPMQDTDVSSASIQNAVQMPFVNIEIQIRSTRTAGTNILKVGLLHLNDLWWYLVGTSCPWPPVPEHGQWTCKYLEAPMHDPISRTTTWKDESETERKSKTKLNFIHSD